ncbi:MAG: hypothetical protein HY796_12220 [Elusimicrobia bacterium]|nr:hypothetical protein [Elusimicrobiota bacterium]
MKKTIKYLAVILLLLFGGILFISSLPRHDRWGVPFDAVMVDGELYFVLGKECGFYGISVFKSSHTYAVPELKVWSWGTANKAEYLKTRQIKYGQEIDGFITGKTPQKLQPHTAYFSLLSTTLNGAFGSIGSFIIRDNNKIVMTYRFDPELPKNRTIIIERNGKQITVPYSVSFDKEGHKVIVSEIGFK